MNAERLIRRIKRSIGIYGIALPVENLDQMIIEILEDTTIPVFSIYSPLQIKFSINIADCVQGNREWGENADLYILPEYLFAGDRELLYIFDVEYNESYLKPHYFPTVMTQVNAYDAIEAAMYANAEKPVVDSLVKPITWHYEHPRKLYIFDALVSSVLTITAGVNHDNSIQSIPPTAAESFFQLAVLDVKQGLYQTMKHYNGIETQFGRIELKIEDWEQAESARADLLKEWDDNYMIDLFQMHYGA